MNRAAAAAHGGRFVWMPVVDALYHRRHNRISEENAVRLLDEQARLSAQARAVIAEAKKHNMTFGTGHNSLEENEMSIEFACEIGIRKVIVIPFLGIIRTADCRLRPQTRRINSPDKN